MAFKRAERNSLGDQILTPGKWFVDTSEENFFEAIDQGLFQVIPEDTVTDTLTSGGRGQIMVEFRVIFDLTVPQMYGALLGYFYELPKDMILKEAGHELYGDAFDEPRGFWEWLNTEHRAVFDVAKGAAETVVDTTESIGKNFKSVILWGGVGVALLLALSQMGKRS